MDPASPFHTTRGSAVTRLVLESFRLHAALLAVGERLTRGLGTTSARWVVLTELQLAAQPRTVPQIARALGLKRQGIQRLVDALIRDGLLVSLPNPDHARAQLITPSDAGRALLQRLNRAQADWANRVGEPLTAALLHRTARGIESLRAAVTAPQAAGRRGRSPERQGARQAARPQPRHSSATRQNAAAGRNRSST